MFYHQSFRLCLFQNEKKSDLGIHPIRTLKLSKNVIENRCFFINAIARFLPAGPYINSYEIVQTFRYLLTLKRVQIIYFWCPPLTSDQKQNYCSLRKVGKMKPLSRQSIIILPWLKSLKNPETCKKSKLS